jgi:hypothetical protein
VRPTSEPEGSIAQTTQEWNAVSCVQQDLFSQKVRDKTGRRLNFPGANGGMCLNAAVGYVNDRA